MFFPRIMLGIYLAVFAFFAYKPNYLTLWITENSIAVITVIALVILYCKGVKFSNLSYFLMTVALCWQTIGGHYCFAEVPFDFITDLFGFKRNHYDRIGHFMVGFFALPALEYFESRRLIRNRGLNIFLVILALFGVAALFEIVEWIYTEISILVGHKKAGSEFLGSQGDIWDAQKDMLCDGIGAIVTSVIYALRYKGKEVSCIIGYRKDS